MMDIRVFYNTKDNGTDVLAGDYTAAKGNSLSDSVAIALIGSGAAKAINLPADLRVKFSEQQKYNLNIKGVAGVGGGKIYDENGDEIFSKNINARLTVTKIGNSYPANGDAISAGLAGAVAGQTSQDALTWALSQIGIPYTIKNLAAGSKTLAEVITLQMPSALIDNSEFIYIDAILNSFNPTLEPALLTSAQILGQLDYLLSLFKNHPLVVVEDVPPLRPGTAVTSGAYPRRGEFYQFNQSAKAMIAAKYPNTIFHERYALWAIDNLGNAKPDVMVSNDGTHPATKDNATSGFSLAKQIKSSGVSFRRFRRASVISQLPRIVGNTGTKTASTGTINGDVADGHNLQIASNATGVIVDASVDEANGKQRLRIRNGNANSSVIRFQLANNLSFIAGIVTNDVMRASGRVDMVSNDGKLYRHDFGLFFNTAYLFGCMQKSGQEDGSGGRALPAFPRESYSVYLSGEAVVAANATDISPVYSIEVGPGGDVTVDLSGMSLEKVVTY
jgi:nucleoside diphosphate kinase